MKRTLVTLCQKKRNFTMACLALVIGALAVSISTIAIMLTASTSFALAPGNQTGGKKMSGSMTVLIRQVA